jgi:hypothetical protein
MYLNGQGTDKDETLAAEWFRKAAEKGHVYAQFQLAEALRQEQGVKQDKKEALKWYREAAKNGPKGLVAEEMLKELTESVKKEGIKEGEQRVDESISK